ncbi:MAG: BatA domain-containing protein [Planctomycetia bacterium]|nr:BatA domain-containing protein [Planctomycetia bacterium]
MQFLAPIMLAGAAAVSIPIALHFFYRARYKPLPWAPMKFLKEAIEQTSRRLRFQEWILLALRCLVIILLALAIARPSWESTASAGRDQAIDAVFVFDTSYSMAALEGEKTRLDQAKEAALTIIDTLPDKSSIQIYTCNDRATLLGPVSRYNRDQAKQLVQQLEISSLSTDFLPGLTEALAAAEAGAAPAKEIYVFTDMQKTGFERQQDALRRKCEEIKEKAALVFIRCGNPERKIPNVAVVDVSLLAAIPHTDTRVAFEITVKNTGRDPIRGVKVALELDGKAIEKDAVQITEPIDPGNTAKVTLTGNLEEAGARVLTVQVEGDGLPGDNVLYKIVPVRDKVRVLLVAYPFAGQNATDAGDWFVRKALVPFDIEKDKDKIEKWFIETESAIPHEVDAAKLANKDVCYLLNAAARTDDPLFGLPPVFITRLRDFVNSGGGLIIGCGDAVDRDAYNRELGGAGLLPMPLGNVRVAPTASPFTPTADSIAETSILARLRSYTDWLERAELTRMFDLEETSPAAAGSQVLMRTTDNKPLVVSRVIGDGEVIFFATSLDERWGRMMSDGDLALPMTTYMVAHLLSRKVPGGVRMAGTPLTWYPSVQAPGFELLKPVKPTDKSGEKSRPRINLGEAKADANQRLAVTTTDTLVAGEYTIVPRGAPEAGVTYVLNPDLRESANLDSANDTEVEKMLNFRPAIIPAGASTEAAVREARIRGEWTEWVLLVLLLLLVGEATWAWFCGRAW